MPIHVTDPSEASQAVAALANEGVDLIKLYSLLNSETFEAAADEAQARDLSVAADLGMIFTGGLDASEVGIVQAAELGITSIEHLGGLALAYHRRGGDPMASAVDEAILDDIADPLLETQVTMVPTLAALMQVSDPGALPINGPGGRTAVIDAARQKPVTCAAARTPHGPCACKTARRMRQLDVQQ